MHMLIYALVDAQHEQDALSRATGTFDRLVGYGTDRPPVFDYYATFDTHHEVAGTARWGDLPCAAPVESSVGADLLEQGWEATVEQFEHNLGRLRQAITELSDEEFMRGMDGVRHACYQLGAYEGPAIPLYDESAEGIRNQRDLDRVLARHDETWIVPADVHF